METATVIRSPADFWWAALTSGLTIQCAVVIALLLVFAVACLGVLVATGRSARRSARPLWADTDGTATIEFALILPLLMFMILTLAQTTLVMGGNLFVHYSAFAATRSAIVQVPREYADSPANTCAVGTSKHEAIHRTAAYALVPVSGPWEGGSSIPREPYEQAFTRFFATYGQPTPVWVANLAGQRLMYAAANTTVDVLQAVAADANTLELREPPDGLFLPKDAIAVRVHHKLNLSMPYANRFWADGVQPDGRGRYRTIHAFAVLTNEGVLDTLPPAPSLPRTP